MKTIVTWILAATVLALPACSGGNSLETGTGTGDPADSKEERIFEDRQELPLRPWRGKVVVLELGCVGCPLTAEIYGHLNRLRAGLPADVVVVRVDHGQSIERTRGFYEAQPPAIHVVGDPSGAIGRALPSQAMPTLYLFGKWGQQRFQGGFKEAEFLSMVEALRAETKPLDENFFRADVVGAGDALPEFTLPALRGGTVALSEFRSGARALVLVFAGTSCPVSVGALKALSEWAGLEEFGDAAFLVVNSGETEETVRTAYEPLGLAFPVLLDEDDAVAATIGLDAVPTVLIAGADGRVAFRSLWNPEAVEQELRVALGLMAAGDKKAIDEEGSG